MAENRISLQRYAMVFGTYMGVFWIFKFIFLPLGFTNGLFNLVFTVLTIAVPFMGYRFARIFRDKACGGTISFLQSWLFMVFMYMFAALLTAVAHYIYFRFLDNGFIVDQVTILMNNFHTDIPQMNAYVEQVKQTLDVIRALTPIEITMQLLSQNFLYCSVLALVTAPFVMKRNPNT